MSTAVAHVVSALPQMGYVPAVVLITLPAREHSHLPITRLQHNACQQPSLAPVPLTNPGNNQYQCLKRPLPQHPSIQPAPLNRTHAEVEEDQDHDSAEQRIPTAWWVGGLLVSGAFCTALLTPMLNLPVIDPLAAVGLALLVAVLAVRALGQTDLNPVSGVGKLSQVQWFVHTGLRKRMTGCGGWEADPSLWGCAGGWDLVHLGSGSLIQN